MIGILGILTAVSFGIALSNYLIKYINKHYISKLGKEKSNIVNNYRKVMRLIIKYHKLAGIVAIVCMLAHIIIAISANRIRITGFIAVAVMAIIFLLGLYGVVTKNYKGKWLKVHRSLAFALIAIIIIHVIFA